MATRTWTVSGPRAERRGYWQAQVEAHRRSRSQAAFCAQRGLRTGTFSFWKWKLKQGAGAGAHERQRRSRRRSFPSGSPPLRLGARWNPRRRRPPAWGSSSRWGIRGEGVPEVFVRTSGHRPRSGNITPLLNLAGRHFFLEDIVDVAVPPSVTSRNEIRTVDVRSGRRA